MNLDKIAQIGIFIFMLVGILTSSNFTGLVTYDNQILLDEIINLNINQNISDQSYLLLSINNQEYTNHSKYQGTIQEMMNICLNVSQDHRINSAAVTDQNQDTDYPETIMYDVDGGWEGVDHLVSSPKRVVINGVERLQLNHARYSGKEGGGISVPLTLLDETIGNISKDEVIGIVFHTFDYADMPLVYDDLFAYLKQEKDVTSSTVSEILESY